MGICGEILKVILEWHDTNEAELILAIGGSSVLYLLLLMAMAEFKQKTGSAMLKKKKTPKNLQKNPSSLIHFTPAEILLSNIETGGPREEKTRGDGAGETHHRALSDEPDACCYAYRGEGSGERRESGRGVEERGRRGGRVCTPALN